MSDDEIRGEYEKQTGVVIVETFRERDIDPLQVGAVAVANHGLFSWGASCEKAVENAAVMEYVAEMDSITLGLNPKIVFSRCCWTSIF